MRKLLGVVGVVVVALAAYLLLWPVPIHPVAWVAPTAPGYVAPHAVNQKLSGLKTISLGDDEGPEHVVVRDGWVYAAVASGAIIRMRPDGSSRTIVVKTGGRPLGFDFDSTGAMIIADPIAGDHGGLLRAQLPSDGAGDARVEVLVDQLDGAPIRYVDGVIVAKSGMIYFTDASQRFGAKEWGGPFLSSVLDIVEHQSTGRLLSYDPATKATHVILGDLCFANGLALSEDEQHVFVNETGAYRIWKVGIKVANASAAHPSGDVAVLIDNLPGYPDNLMRGSNGRIWAGLAKPRGAFVDDNAGKPWMRSLAMRLPKSLWPVPPAYGHVFAFDENGKVLIDLQDPSGTYPETTGVTESADRIYIQSLHAKTLGWMATPEIGR